MASAILAVILSFFIPGLGQFYTGQFLKAVLLFVLWVVFGGITLFSSVSLLVGLPIISMIPLVICIFIWLYGMYDAFCAASR
jgi:TM2 domain-containing membrane protein YozV